mgnify:FL=1
MKKNIYILFLLLSTFSYSSVMYVKDEEGLENVFTTSISTSSRDILVIPSSLLKSLSDENKGIIKKLHCERKYDFAGTAYTEVVLPLLHEMQFESDVNDQIEKGRKVYQEIFNDDPSIFYAEYGIISNEVAEILMWSGYSGVLTTSCVAIDLKNKRGLKKGDRLP